MKLLFFHPLTGYLARGIERNVVGLSAALAQQEHEVTILTLRHPEGALLDALPPNVRLVRTPRSRYYSYPVGVPFFAAHLLRNQYDMVIVFFGGFGVGASLAIARCVKKIPVSIFLGYPVSVAPHRYTEFERWNMPAQARGIWAHGEHVAAQAADRFKRTVTALPSGVDTDLFHASAQERIETRKRLGIGEDAPLVLTVAALERRKGLIESIRAMARVREALPRVKHVIAGEGDQLEAIVQEVRRLKLEDTVILLGAQQRVQRLYAAADVFILLSRGEAGPLVLYEALASQVPVVTLAEPHLHDHLSEDVATLLPDINVELVASALLALLTDPVRRERMGSRGRQLVEQQYSYASLAHHVVQLIQFPERDHPGLPMFSASGDGHARCTI